MMSSRGKRRTAIGGGLLVGVGLGSLLTWLLDIYEIAHPTLHDILSPGYPRMALTAFVLILFSGAFGVGLGLMASTLTRDEDVRQNSTATAADPSDAARAQKTKPTARAFFGFVRGN